MTAFLRAFLTLERVAHTLDLNVLRAIDKSQLFGAPHSQRVAAVEDLGQPEATPEIEGMYGIYRLLKSAWSSPEDPADPVKTGAKPPRFVEPSYQFQISQSAHSAAP